MSSITISLIVFACVFGGALPGISLRASLPEHHLSADSRDAVMLGWDMAGLVLGLSIEGDFDIPLLFSLHDSRQVSHRFLLKSAESR